MASKPVGANSGVNVGTLNADGHANTHVGDIYNNQIPDGKAKNELLLRAITKGQTARVVHLLGTGADIDYQDQEGQGVLHYAIASGHEHVFDVLVHRGADVDLESPLQGTPLCAAAQLQRWSIVEKLIEMKVDVNLATDLKGTPLHWACRWGNTDIVDLLLRHGALSGVLMDISLVKASSLRVDHEHVKALDPEKTTRLQGVPVSDVRTALLLAAQFGHQGSLLSFLKSYTQRSEILTLQAEGQLALRYAVCHGSRDSVRMLLQHHISPDSDEDPEGNRALLVAFEHERWDLFEELLKHNARTNVVQRDDRSMLRLLLSAKCDDTKREHSKQFFLARWHSFTLTHYPVAQLINSDRDRFLRMLLKVRNDFASALRRQDIGTLEMHFIYQVACVEDYTLFSTMQNLGGNIDVTDHPGNTALSLATNVGDIEAMKRLLAASVSAELAFEPEHRRPLILAVENLHVEAVELLLSKDANPNVTNPDGWTPLHFAAEHGRVDIIELLIKAGAGIDAKDADGYTPIEVALNWQQRKAMNALERLGAAPVDSSLLI